jgi:Family of unknown function (DUF6319)
MPRSCTQPQELTVTMTVDTLPANALETGSDTPTISQAVVEGARAGTSSAPEAPASDASTAQKPKKSPAKKVTAKKTKTLELTLTVPGTADGEWRAELKQGSTYLHATSRSRPPRSPAPPRSSTRTSAPRSTG